MNKFDEQLFWGFCGEKKVSQWLIRALSASTLPVQVDKFATKFKGPRIETPEEEIVSPDILAVREGRLRFIEVKRKTNFTWYRVKRKWETGIDKPKYHQYVKENNDSGLQIPMWLLFLHESTTPSRNDLEHGCNKKCPNGLFGQSMTYLSSHVSHICDTPQIGAPYGMVYWTIDDLLKLADHRELYNESQGKLFRGDEDAIFNDEWGVSSRNGEVSSILIAEAIPAAKVSLRECDHNKDLYDKYGKMQGSWVDEETRYGIRVVCGSCGKFYGYKRGQESTQRSLEGSHNKEGDGMP